MTLSASLSAFLLTAAPANPGTLPAAPPAIPVAPPAIPAAAPAIVAAPVATVAAVAAAPAEPTVPAPAAALPGEPAAPAALPQEVPADSNVITVSGHTAPPPGDPLEKINVKSIEVVQGVDTALVAPVASVYRDVLPNPLRTGLRNVLRNLDEPVVFVNFLLQLKPLSAVRTLGRFAINSTVGIGGLIDVAKSRKINLPYRPNGFANTMGFYGVKPGPFMFLPIVGPTTLRDVIGLGLDRAFLPRLAGPPLSQPLYATGASVVRSLDYRVEFDDTLRQLHEEASDPYAASREYYLKMRQAEIDGLRTNKPPKPVEVLPAEPSEPADMAPATTTP